MYEFNLALQKQSVEFYQHIGGIPGVIQMMSYQDFLNIKESYKQKIDFFDFALTKIQNSMKPDYYNKQLLHIIHLLKVFCEHEGVRELCIADIDSVFISKFVMYLTKVRNLMTNTIKGYVQKATYFVSLAKQEGLQVASDFREIQIEDEETSGIYLTRGEITRLYYHPLKTQLRREVRDLFVMGCCIGMRYSDYSTLTSNNFDIAERKIRKKTKKTGAPAVIPMHDYVVEIYNRYNGVPKVRCSQWFNKAIKNICKEIGLDEEVYWERTVGGEVVCKTFKKYELVSSHTARRSFATNMYIEGFPLSTIRAFTTHKTESSCLKYIRFSLEDVADANKHHRFFRK